MSGCINKLPELVPRAASLLNDGIRMDDMNAGSWQQLGTHARDGARDEVFLCARVVTVGVATLDMPFAHMRSQMSLKDDPTWSRVLGMQLAAPEHSADASRHARTSAVTPR